MKRIISLIAGMLVSVGSLDCCFALETADQNVSDNATNAANTASMQTVRTRFDFVDKNLARQLINAVKSNNEASVRDMLHPTNPEEERRIKQVLYNATDAQGNSPLLIAVINQNLPIARLLSHYPAGLNIRNDHGDRPLALAASLESIEILNTLLQAAYSHPMDVFENVYVDAISAAQTAGHQYIAEHIHIAHLRSQVNVILRRVSLDEQQKVELLRKLIFSNSEIDLVNATHPSGIPLLLFAIAAHQTKVASFFIEQGADINAVDPYGNNSLKIAAKIGENSIVQQILQHPDLELTREDANAIRQMAQEETAIFSKTSEVQYQERLSNYTSIIDAISDYISQHFD